MDTRNFSRKKPIKLAYQRFLPSKPTNLYIVEAVSFGIYKIGISDTPARRLADLQSSSPMRLIMLGYWSSTAQAEYLAHKYLDDYRLHGEWFSAPIQVIANALGEIDSGLSDVQVMADIESGVTRITAGVARASSLGNDPTVRRDDGRPYVPPPIPGIQWKQRGDGALSVDYLPLNSRDDAWRYLATVPRAEVERWARSTDDWLPMRWIATRRSRL